jgi:carboxypeptidase C (cathepsin A)
LENFCLCLPRYSPKVLVYNGDVDPGCNYLWAEASVAAFELAVKTEWGPWVYEDALVGEQLGGFSTEYLGGVTFATVHGAGHMSPQWRPEAVYNMFSRFLGGMSLQE